MIGLAAQRVALAFCESPLANDENAVYTSYFFFLDGTSDTPMISESGSTDPTDKDGALKNTVDEIAGDIKNWWENLKDTIFNSSYAKIIAVGFGIVLIVLIGVLIIRLIRFAFSGGGKRRR